jgi:antirestriction protein ArdC
MSKRSAAATGANPYERVTATIIERLEAGVVPWRQPWRNVAGGNIPRNALTSRPYSGINRIVTSISGYGDPRWLTYKQARSVGGHVRRGEHGTPILYWNVAEHERDDGETVRRGFARVYTLFNVAQCEALKLPEERAGEPRHVYHPVAAEIIDGYDGPTFDHEGGSRAYYVPKRDAVHLPRPEARPRPEPR